MEDVYLRLREINLNALKDRKERIAVFFDFDNTLYKGNMLKDCLLLTLSEQEAKDLENIVKKYQSIKEIENVLNQKLKDRINYLEQILKFKAWRICDDWKRGMNFVPKAKKALEILLEQRIDLYLLSYSPVNYLTCLRSYFKEIYGSGISNRIRFINKGKIVRDYANQYDFIFMITDDFDMDYNVVFNSKNSVLIIAENAEDSDLYTQSFYYVLKYKDALDMVKAVQTIYYAIKISNEGKEKIKKVHELLRKYRSLDANDCDSKIQIIVDLLEHRNIDYTELRKKSMDEIVYSYFPEIYLYE